MKSSTVDNKTEALLTQQSLIRGQCCQLHNVLQPYLTGLLANDVC